MTKVYTNCVRLISALILIFVCNASQAQLTGTKTIGPAGNYTTFAAAVTDLNALGVGSGGVTFDVTAGVTFTETVPVITATGTAANPIIFQKSGAGANPKIIPSAGGTVASSTTIGGNGDGIVVINGGDYITFDGIDLQTDATFSGTAMYEYGYYLKKASATDACKNLTIRNCSVTLNKAAIYSFGIFVSNISGTASVTVSGTGGRSENIKIYSNTITNCYGGIQVRGYAHGSAPYDFYDQNIEIGVSGANIINDYGGGGSTAYGIYGIYQNNIKIDNNNISGGTATTTTHYGVFMSTANNANIDIEGNTIDIANSSTTTQVTNISIQAGTTGTSNTHKINNNILTVNRSAATSGVTYFIYTTSNSPSNLYVTGNTIGNSTLSGTGAIYGIYQGGNPGNGYIQNNTILNISRAGTTSTSAFYGINSDNSAGTTQTTVSGNTIKTLSGSGSTGAVGGILLGTQAIQNVYNNSIFDISSNNAGGVVYGITVASGVVTGNIYNNYISDLKSPSGDNNTTDLVRGINITSTTASSSINLYYNTIYLNATSSGVNFTTSGVYHTLSATATTAVLKMQNNIIVNASTPKGIGYAVAYRRSASTSYANVSSACDKNLFYAGTPSPSNLIFYDGTNSDQTLSSYKTRVSPRDAASVSESPTFINVATTPYNLHLSNTIPTQAESGGMPVAGITTDFDGDTRNATTPDIGADELAGVQAIPMTVSSSITTQLTGNAYVGQANAIIRIAVTTTGSASALSATQFTLNANGTTSLGDISNATLYYTGGSATYSTGTTFGTTASLSLSSYTISGNQTLSEGVNYFWLAYTLPAGATASNIIDAECTGITISTVGYVPTVTAPAGNKVIVGPMAGPYDISPAAVFPNFTSINEAVANLNARGVSAAVTLNVLTGTGPYNEQVTLVPVTGASPINTITFNGNGNVISDNGATSTNERAVIKLNGADNIIIDGFTINTGSGTYGFGVQLLNDADNNIIRNCTINGNTSSNSTVNYAGIVINSSVSSVIGTGSSLCDNNTISNNTINGGYAGVSIAANGSTSIVSNNKVINNVINDFYEYGVFINGNVNTLVEGNDISRPTRSTVTTFRGIGLSGISNGTLVSKNRLHNPFGGNSGSTAAAFMLYITACNATVGTENIFSNNLMYDHIGGTGNHNGFLNNISSNVKFYHNTIYLNDVAATCTSCAARGMYQQGAAPTGLDYRNNIIVISQGGDAPKQAIFFEAASVSGYTLSNNNYYITSTGGAYNEIARIGGSSSVPATGTGFVTITDWQAGSGKEAGSLSIDPLFTDALTGNLKPKQASMDDKGTNVGITTDILGVSRSATVPDIGAYEYSPPPCVDPPTAGSATSSASGIVCNGASVALGLTGNTSGAGQTYIWEKASSAGGTYTTISSSSPTFSLTVNPTVSTFYRCQVTCGTHTELSAPIEVQVYAPFNGIYTIDAGQPASLTNFQTFGAAISAISDCGIVGPVEFQVTTNTYNEQITIPAIPGASATNTITFKGNLATLLFNTSTSATRSGIILNGADHIIIDSLNINGNAGTYGWGILLMNQADSNTISNCTINVSTSNTTSAYHIGIAITGSTTTIATSGNNGNGNKILYNTIIGGYYGVALYGNSTAGAQNLNNVVKGNTIKDAYAHSVYTLYQSGTLIDSNDITRPTRSSVLSGGSGVYLSTGDVNMMVSRNRIHNMFGGAATSTSTLYSIYVSADGVAGQEIQIINNLIYNPGGDGTAYGIYNTTAPYMKAYHNTIAMDNQNAISGATYGFYQTGAADGIDFRNNIVYVTRSGTGLKRALFFNTMGSTITSNKNVLYVSGGADIGVGALAGDNSETLADWQSVNNGGTFYDQQSVSIDPMFVNVAGGEYVPTEPSINNIGLNLGITKDIVDSVRIVATPDPGAFEFSLPPCVNPPSAGVAIASNLNACSGTPFTLDLTSNSTGNSQTYQWQYSPDDAAWTNVGSASSASLYGTSQTVSTYYRALVQCGAGAAVPSASVQVITPGLISGTFSIDAGQPTGSLPGGGMNFQTFGDAINYIKCGINGPVVFDVAAGSFYSEQIVIPVIPGASPVNTITFNGNGAILAYTTTVSAKRSAIILNGADYIRIDSLMIDVSGGTYGWGVSLINQADNNIIRKCIINNNTTATTSNFLGIAINGSAVGTASSGNNGNNNQILNNTMNGGYYGVYLYGASATPNAGNIISGNTITNFYSYGIYTIYQTGALVSHNDISRPSRSGVTTTYGIYITTGDVNCLFEKNRIHNLFDAAPASTSTLYAFYVAADGTAALPNKIVNNLVYNTGGNGTLYGIYNTTGPYMYAYHNTIALNDQAATTGTAYGIYQTGASAGIDVRNNIIYVSRSGTGLKRALDFETITSTITSNYNALYMPSGLSGTDNNLVEFGTDVYATLIAWKASNSNAYDQNSVSVDPMFFDPGSGDFTPTSPFMDNIAPQIAGVTTDIRDSVRNVTADPGAYEFSVAGDFIAPVASYTPLTYTCSNTDRTLAGVSINDIGGIPTTGPLVPRIYYKKKGTISWYSNAGTLTSGNGNIGTWSFTILNADMGGIAMGDTVQYFIISQDNAGNIASSPVGATASNVNTVTVYPSNPNTYRYATLAGVYSVGAGGNYETLAAAVDAYNNSCLTGAVVFELTKAAYNETGSITINRHPDASVINTLTIRPATGVNATITGNVANGQFLRILSNYVIIDGSNNGSSSRNLTITNSNTTGPTTMFIGGSGTTPITNVTVKNSIIINGSSASSAIVIREAAGGYGYFNDLTIQNNSIQKAYNGIYAVAQGTGTNGSGTVITGNDISTSGTNAVRFVGIYLFGARGAVISNNTIGNFEMVNGEIDKGIFIDATQNSTVTGNTITNLGYSGTGAYAGYGIYVNQSTSNANITDNTISGMTTSGTMASGGIYVLNSNITGTTIQRNYISNIKNTNTGGYGAYGIWLSSSSATANTNIRNNFIWDVAGYGSATSLNNGIGIAITAGAGYNIYHNTVRMNTNQTATAGLPSVINISNAITAAGAINLRNNLLVNSQTIGTERYVVYSAAANTVFADMDYNDYWTAGPNIGYIGSNRVDMAAMIAGFGSNANSVNVQPVFAGTSDLHIDPPTNFALDNKGTAIGSIATDIDGETRSATTPDVGADEFTSTTGIEVGLKSLIAPVTKVCYSNAETVTVKLRNFSASTHDFAVNPVTVNASVTGGNPITFPAKIVNTGTLNSGDSMDVVISTTYDMSTVGTYTFNATVSIAGDGNASNDAIPPTARTVVAVAAGSVSSDRTSYCITGGTPTLTHAGGSGIGAIQWQSAANISGPWNNVGTNSNTYTPGIGITATTYYRVVASCGLNTNNSNVVTVALENPLVTSTTPASRCGTGIVTLGATGSAGTTLSWYTTPSGGTPLYTGTSFTTPVLSSSTNYYVSASTGGGGAEYVGALNTTIGTISSYSTDFYYLIFDVLSNTTIESVDIFPTAAVGTAATIEILSSSGTVLFSVPYVTTVTGGAVQTVPLNITMTPGTSYRMKQGTGTGNYLALNRNTTGATFPYTSTTLNITGHNFSGYPQYYYFFYNWRVSAGCASPRTMVAASINGPSSPAAGAVGTTECSSNTISGATQFIYTDCDLIATVIPSGGAPVSGNVNSCVKIDASVQTAPNGEPYVQRHFDITPTSNPATATSSITLYFLQSEFTAFNAANGTFADLPTGSSDAAGIANLRITQYNGTGTAPGNYTGSAVQIDPVDANITFNSVANRWEVTFDAVGSGGFYVHTGHFVLPVTILNFRGEEAGSANKLLWSTSTETNNKGFELQRSADGRNFSSVGFVNTKADNGNSTVTLNYSFNDNNPLQGNNYYRLKQVDRDGKSTYSNVVLLSRKVKDITLSSVYPNPTTKEINLVITSPRAEKLTIIITDLTGKVVKQQPMSVVVGENQQAFNVQQLAQGTYLIKAVCANGCETAVHRFVKQ